MKQHVHIVIAEDGTKFMWNDNTFVISYPCGCLRLIEDGEDILDRSHCRRNGAIELAIQRGVI